MLGRVRRRHSRAQARYLVLPLTTLCEGFATNGRVVIAMLTAAISGDTGDTDQVPSLIDPELIVRASSAPPGQTRSRAT